MTKMNVAVLGLGLMGGGMARQLLASGFTVAVWNRSAAKAEAVAEHGARVATSPADAARGADIVIAMLADDAASRTAWIGTDGAMTAMAPGTIAIDSGTLTPGWIATLASEAEARGLRFLEAPVTGSRDQAASGALRFLVGGDADTLATARAVLDAMAGAIVHLGPVGSAAIVKLANNYLCGLQAAGLAEAIALLEKKGLDVEQAVSVLTDGAPGSPLVKAMSRRMLDRAYTPHFVVPLMAKDLAYAAEAMASVGITSEIARAARQRYLEAELAGEGRNDVAAIVEPLRKAPVEAPAP